MNSRSLPVVKTGIPDFDAILRGGLPQNRLHLIEGAPGTGKTTIAQRFLLQGIECGERCLYVTLSESTEELTSAAMTHGWSLDGIDILEVVPEEEDLGRQQTVLYPAEVEFGQTISRITAHIAKVAPARVVIDSLSDLRMLAHDPLLYRRQLLALKRFLQGRKITTVVLDDLSGKSDGNPHSLVHGVIALEQLERDYGKARRRLRIVKMRGTDMQTGWHDFSITPQEVFVFPSLIADEHRIEIVGAPVRSGIAGLDKVLNGGLDRGTSTLLVGPSGVGKSSMALCFAMAVVRQGEYASYFTLEETFENFSCRAEALGIPVKSAVEKKQLGWRLTNPSRLSPGEFVWQVRREVEDKGARLIVIDSLNSYLGTIEEEQTLILQMHELLTYLNNQGVVTILILAQRGIVSDVQNPIDMSFLSDNVVLLRYFEAAGELRKALSVVKRRTGAHDNAIHEYRVLPNGMQVGPAISGLQGIFTGVPTYTGSRHTLMNGDHDARE
ncbi:AAA family ATPase [Robbsia sp. Bb-Pol-6]|uniref:non-specific serine/threonine protein kinase n=1 Tax=Robbsia betulipollinis TaxID=2981849 RepID=A0ABT3ZK39_9BURK|nr:AAA family ATPase [Robbsia betulipollinis]